MRRLLLVAAALLAVAPGLAQPGLAQSAPVAPPGAPPPPGAPMPPGMGAGMGEMHAPPARRAEPAYEQGYREAMERMHRRMDIPFTGNADRDFVDGMIPHHQGAIDMARLELRYGRDPALRRLAQDIIRAQEKEIAFMQSWQKRHHR